MGKRLNTLGQTLVTAGYKAKLDTAIKKILAEKPVLAWILQYTVSEFEGPNRQEIEELIENPSVASIPVYPGTTNDMITGMPQESAELGENTVTYDVRFFAKSPKGKTPAEYTLIINIEAQGTPYRSYYLETRGIAYCCRLISEQM